jgi:hypothetical protein
MAIARHWPEATEQPISQPLAACQHAAPQHKHVRFGAQTEQSVLYYGSRSAGRTLLWQSLAIGQLRGERLCRPMADALRPYSGKQCSERFIQQRKQKLLLSTSISRLTELKLTSYYYYYYSILWHVRSRLLASLLVARRRASSWRRRRLARAPQPQAE